MGTVFPRRDGKRQNPWVAEINVPYDENGVRQRRRVRSYGFSTEVDAEAELHKMLAKKGLGDPDDATIGATVSAYIDACEALGNRSPNTIRGYNVLRNHALAEIADRKIAEIDPKFLREHYSLLLRRGTPAKRKPLSQTTVWHADTLLRVACKWARRENRIRENPFDVHKIEKPKRSGKHFRALTEEDARKFLNAVDPLQQGHNAALFCLATGVRRGECVGLRESEIDLPHKTATIRESRYKIKGIQAQKMPKTNRIREIHLNPIALRALKQERGRMKALRRAAGEVYQDSGFAFVNVLGQPLQIDSPWIAFQQICKDAGLDGKQYVLHSLRHTFATLLLSHGEDLTSVSAALGHANPSITLGTYSHVVSGKVRQATDKIARILADGEK